MDHQNRNVQTARTSCTCKPSPEPPVVPAIDVAYEAWAAALDRCRQLSEREGRLARALERCRARFEQTAKLRDQARAELVRQVIAADDRADHDLAEWFFSPGPAWEVRSGGRIFALSPSGCGAMPSPDRSLDEILVLAVIDLKL